MEAALESCEKGGQYVGLAPSIATFRNCTTQKHVKMATHSPGDYVSGRDAAHA